MNETYDLILHPQHVLEANLSAQNTDDENAIDEDGFAIISASGFAIISASGFAIISASGFAII